MVALDTRADTEIVIDLHSDAQEAKQAVSSTRSHAYRPKLWICELKSKSCVLRYLSEKMRSNDYEREVEVEVEVMLWEATGMLRDNNGFF